MKVDYRSLLEEVYEEVRQDANEGKVADYIPELACVGPNHFGMALMTASGEEFGVGDYEHKISIQSISKVFTLAMAYELFGNDIWKRMDVEPSGNSFNSLVQLETEKGIPRNPFINAGALVVTDMLVSHFGDPITFLLDFISNTLDNRPININLDVANSEIKHSDRNKALAYFMKSFGNINNDIERLIEVYSHQCAIELSCAELAASFLALANQGYSIHSQKRILSKSATKRVNALMQTCGCYDEAGEFAFEIGLPGKSGVGGGIVAILPNQFSVAVWSPRLNPKGNSARGMKALEILTTKLGHSLY